jgi:putative MATE family efflux protein
MMQQQRDRMLGTESIGRLLVRLSLPASVAMIVMALYNLVDSIFVGRGVGVAAIGGLTISFPLQMLVMAFSMMIGTGAASVVSRSLGAGNRERAHRAAGNAMASALVFGLTVTLLGRLFLPQLLRLFGATPVLSAYARDYLTVILSGTVFISFAMAVNNLVRAEGRATVAMATMILGAVVNMLLDPLFIFGFKMGIRGAALATVISQFLSFVFLLVFFAGGYSSLRIRLRHLLPDRGVLREILVLGFPALVRQGVGSVLVILMNNALARYGGDIYISVFGLVFRILHFVLMPILGVVQGSQPIIGYNYGAGSLERVKRAVRLSVSVATVLSAAGFLLLMTLSGPVFRLFSSDPALAAAGVPVLRLMVLILPLVGVQMIGTTYFQAVGKARPAMFLGLSRQVIFLLPLVIILPRLFGLWGVFSAFPAADFLSSIITGVWLYKDVRSLSGGKEEGGEQTGEGLSKPPVLGRGGRRP